ncbi:hypothetical protein CYMTET_40366, partial [Cymbomonas tetramitiformis]
HFHAWRKGLKTGMYYLRTKSAADAIKFTVDAVAAKASAEGQPAKEEEEAAMVCSLKNRDDCMMCGA